MQTAAVDEILLRLIEEHIENPDSSIDKIIDRMIETGTTSDQIGGPLIHEAISKSSNSLAWTKLNLLAYRAYYRLRRMGRHELANWIPF